MTRNDHADTAASVRYPGEHKGGKVHWCVDLPRNGWVVLQCTGRAVQRHYVLPTDTEVTCATCIRRYGQLIDGSR